MENQKQEKVTSGPISIRMNPETNERFKSLSAEFGFVNQNAAMENLIAAFELQQARNLIPTRAKEIEEFAEHTKRLNDIYLNALELNINTEDFIRKEYSQRLETQQGVIQSQQEQIAASKLTIADSAAQLKESQKIIIEFEKSMKAAEAQATTQSQLISEYREKNETLSSMITKNQLAIDQSEQIKSEYQSLQSEFTTYKAKVANEIIEQNRVNEKQLSDLTKTHDKQLSDMNKKIDQAAAATERLVEKHQAAIERAKEQAEILLEKLSNKLQAEYQTQLQTEREHYNVLQANHQIQIHEIHDKHNEQIAELLQKMQNELQRTPLLADAPPNPQKTKISFSKIP